MSRPNARPSFSSSYVYDGMHDPNATFSSDKVYNEMKAGHIERVPSAELYHNPVSSATIGVDLTRQHAELDRLSSSSEASHVSGPSTCWRRNAFLALLCSVVLLISGCVALLIIVAIKQQ